MATDALAPAELSGAPNEDEYQTFCAALSASARGRAFLAEYAHRHRGADTETLLAALARLEMVMRTQARAGAGELRGELNGLVAAIRAARLELAQAPLPARAAKLAMLLDMLERRLLALTEPAQAAAQTFEASEAAEAARAARLEVVPPSDEPELPIPTPAAAQPVLALAHERAPAPLPAASSVAAIPEVSWFDGAPAAAIAAEIASAPPAPAVAQQPRVETIAPSVPPPPVVKTAAASAPPPLEAAPPAPAIPEPVAVQPAAQPAPASDPLEALLALTEEERIALFT